MIWQTLKKPVIGLAPMHKITNSVFRLECKKFGAEIVYTEMIAAEAIIRNISKASQMAQFNQKERPVIIQIFGQSPESLFKAAKIIETQYQPDGIDLNFGCPVEKAVKQGFGAEQLRNPQKAEKICKLVKKVLQKTPLSVKMRLIDSSLKNNLDFINKIKPYIDALAIHGRTLNQQYKGEANWNVIYEIKKQNRDLIILGNGDIKTDADFKEKLKNLDGVLVGRAARKNPNIFQDLKKIKENL